MIAKINELKRTTQIQDIKLLCETTIAAMSSAIYNSVTSEARFEIERVALENLFEGLSKYPKDKLISEWLKNEQRLYSIKNIGVRKTINALKEKEAKEDQALSAVLEHFEEKVNTLPEVLIYEEFISALAGEYNWVPGVATQLDALSQRVSNYKNDIDISKIIETMKATKSNYLLPLIEDVVNNYLSNKTEQTKSHLKETLVKFSYDPFVKDLINIVMVDAKDLQLEYANSGVDIEKVFSPLLYLGENEVAFNVKGTFYIKKGNNINRVKRSDVEKLDENFRAVCEAVNVPNVELNKKEITVYVDNDKAVINEDTVTVNTHVMNEEDFKSAAEVSKWTGNAHFFMLTEILRANFNEIVEVDFVKRVHLKEDESHAADIMKLRNNIYITTYDPINNKSTFFRNINPIQAEKVMMEHMRFDVSNTFADILPNKEKILAQIEETKKSYIEYINTLNEKIEIFKRQGESETTHQVLEALQEELKEIKIEYKDYVNEIEKYTSVAENVTVSIDVDGEKYTVPIPEPTSTAKGEKAADTTGIVVGAEHMEDSPASEITFDDDQTELLGDSPSIQDDEVDLGVDNVEAQADAAEAEADEETEVSVEEPEAEVGGDEELGLGGEEDEEELDLGTEEEEEKEEEEEEKTTEEGENDEYSLKKDISEEGDNEEAAEEIEAEVVEPAPEELEKTDLEDEETTEETTEEVEVEDVDVKERPANAPRVFLKKKISESKNVKKKSESLNEDGQIGDTVTFDKKKGYVIGQTNDGDLLVQIQGSTEKVKPSKVKSVDAQEITTKPPYEFDKTTLQNLTTKSLFEQYVKCGIYMGSTPVKLNECFVKFNEWNDAENEKPVSVIIEGRTSFFPKSQIRILENINDFANPDNYVEGVIIDEESGEAEENVLINVSDFTQVIGDSDLVRIVKEENGEQIISSAPVAILRTLSV